MDFISKKMVQTTLNFDQWQQQPKHRSPRHKPTLSCAANLKYDADKVEDPRITPHSISPLDIPELSALKQAAHETNSILPNVLATTPHAPPHGHLYCDPPTLASKYCPRFPPTTIRILNSDTLDSAIGLAECSQYISFRDKKPVCVLNMANACNAGGGWKRGALAQEETLCYRSSLSFTLKLRYYPIPELAAIYSPTVVVIRKSIKDGHGLLPLDDPGNLPVVSVISVAALCRPSVEAVPTSPGSKVSRRERYTYRQDRKITKEKMRLILRTAAINGHRRLILGALGCGAFLNPREEVADCWAEVLTEEEFSGGWWESIIFAVMDDLGQGEQGDGNYGVFYRKLNGMMV
ncbi:hypothetical protein LOZ61_006392 [Ophidiomyces ophidiicola]|uniref:Uncharacterized protein n=1 Tax=Ophidiomyces ophidiicola TaxID=1387563 RepID=A0ACB8UPF3_9EURO|nr:hypothetical protein LOZ61_006392 [Ophidiomyces ophidiicola]KAI1921652.1 hypothetical protein LOZ60_006102 [Ophidiomyces ophidiicola]KAI1949544.1 hypothetical protein LOZ59_006071 [Ophidiomyces ophidiicola]KAI1964555.1 hypothetical protein LOZ56_006147 [Ophidiomyces ophidiicola]KAI2028136.1 hypothetical protein LOZ48_004367 [Ophidiomyces ophidiicola]